MNTHEIVNNTPPPGFFIAEELEARGWSQTDLAYILGVSVQSVNPVLSGKRSISTEMARALGEAFDVSPEFFSNLQIAYDLSNSKDPDPGISRRARLQEHFPIREFIKRGWINDEDRDISLLEAQVTRFFRTRSLDSIPYLSHAAKKTRYEERHISPVQLSWLFRVYQISEEMVVSKYSQKSLQSCVDEFKGLLNDPENIRHVPRMLADCGIRFLVVESLPNAKIDGVCLWLDNSSPVIAMSLRYDRIDNFWFVLRHEIEHVLKKHGQKDEILDDLDGTNGGVSNELPEEERIANAAAAEFCAPGEQVVSFIRRKSPYLSERDVLGLSSKLKVHPGIVVGQIQRRTDNYRLLRKYLIRIREHITPYSVHDGWGDVYPVNI